MFPLVVAQSSANELVGAIGRLAAPFAELAPGQDTYNRLVDGEPVLVGEINGLSYMLERSGTVFAISWGFLTRVSAALKALVIGCVFDPLEEHSEFFAARGGMMLRALWHNPRRATRAYSEGSPLPCESVVPLCAPEGAGVTAALKSFGFPLMDHLEGFDRAPGDRWMMWKGDSAALLLDDELVQRVNEHVRTHANPDYHPPTARVTVRRI
jgi:hypothetical protein